MNTGDLVVTRRGKTGRVVALLANGNLSVQFGSYDPIELRPGQVVTKAAYERMQAGGRVMASQQRLNTRI